MLTARKSEGVRKRTILEIIENYKLRIPPTVYYDLKADIVNFEEPTTKNDLGVEHHKQNIQAYAHDFGVSEEQAEKELVVKNDLGVDCISRDSAIKALDYDIKCFEFKRGVNRHMDDIAKLLNTIYETQVNNIKALPSTPQEPKIIPIAEIKYDEDKLKELMNKAVLTVTSQEPILDKINKMKSEIADSLEFWDYSPNNNPLARDMLETLTNFWGDIREVKG